MKGPGQMESLIESPENNGQQVVINRGGCLPVYRLAGVRGSRTHPGTGSRPRNGFEDRETHRNPSTPTSNETAPRYHRDAAILFRFPQPHKGQGL